MKKYIISIATLLLAFGSFAQETTYGGVKSSLLTVDESRAKVMVISFRDDMYRSDIDRELGLHNGMEQRQLQQFFQRALPETIMETFSAEYNVIPFNESNADSNAYLMSFIRESLTYKYETLKETDDSTGRSPILKRSRKPATTKNGIIDGQVMVEENKEERYMKAIITNDTLIRHLLRSYNFDYLVLVNELDLTYHVENPDMAAYGGINKQVKTHYTIYSREGRLMDSGAKKTYIGYQEKDINLIASKSLPEVSKKILKSFRSKVEKESN